MRDLTVLVTGAGAKYTPDLFRCLRENGERKIRIIGVDPADDGTIPAMVDKFYNVPYADKAEYYSTLHDICMKEEADVLWPTMSNELLRLNMLRNVFEEAGTKVSVSSAESITTCTNKLSLYSAMKEKGIDTPHYRSVSNLYEYDDALKSLGYPKNGVCIKAVNLSGSRGVRILDPKKSRFDILFGEKPNSMFTTAEELRSILAERESFPEMMAMEYLPGEEYSVDVLADHGKVLYICGRQSNTILASIPQSATLYKDTRAYDIVTEVVEALGIDGNADFDFKYDSYGCPVLMECNPRTAATMAIFKEGGLNLPYLRIKQLLGEPLPDVEIKYGLKMVRRYQEWYCE